MRIAVTEHAVDRYIDRVEGSKGFMRESIREIIRGIVEDGFKENAVRPHPLEKERRIIPFKSGESVLFLSIGPNLTSFKDPDLAVISVLYEHEVSTGKVGMGVTLGDVSDLSKVKVKRTAPKYIICVDGIEEYTAADDEDLKRMLKTIEGRHPEVRVYQLIDWG